MQMRIHTEEWQLFVPGVRMYRGKKTYFYNGEKLWDDEHKVFIIYDFGERDSWEVIIVLPGVEMIPGMAFYHCINIKAVVMSDSVKRIEYNAFDICKKLAFVKLSTGLEYIGEDAFAGTKLTSIFIPPSCQEICDYAFQYCEELIILSVPQDTRLGINVIEKTALLEASPFYARDQEDIINDEVNEWLKNINEQYELHRVCSSFNPLENTIYRIVQMERSLDVFNRKNSIGITPSQYLEANPFAEVKEQKIINRFILEMMGEIVL